MKVKGFIAEVGRTTSGTGKESGKEWTCRELSLLLPYFNDKGEEKFDNVVADYFGDTPDCDLQTMIDERTPLMFTVGFSTRTYNGRRYQTARLWNITLPV